jgi:hypothetical protein
MYIRTRNMCDASLIHTYTHTYIHTYIHTYTHTHTYTQAQTVLHCSVWFFWSFKYTNITHTHIQYIHTYIQAETALHWQNARFSYRFRTRLRQSRFSKTWSSTYQGLLLWRGLELMTQACALCLCWSLLRGWYCACRCLLHLRALCLQVHIHTCMHACMNTRNHRHCRSQQAAGGLQRGTKMHIYIHTHIYM